MIGAARVPYLSHFALREAPFAPAADSRFFYADPARQQCLDMLLHLAEYSEEWLLVNGPSGVGKSRLLHEFCARSDPHLRLCRLDGKEAVDGAQLFLRIAASFGLDPARGDGDPLEALRAHLGGWRAEQLPVVAVDDADRLSDDALEILLHLATLDGTHGKLLRVILFAQAALRHRLAAERFSAFPKPHLLEVHPFDENHSARYLVHRMSTAGYEGPNPFDAGTVREIFKETAGLPGRLNGSADLFLRDRMADARGDAGASRLRRVIAPAAAVMVLAGAGLLLLERPGAPIEAPAVGATIPPATTMAAAPPERPLTVPENRSAPEVLPPEAAPAATAPEPLASVSENAASDTPGAAWLEAQRPDHFTLQLLAASRDPTIRWFLETHPPEGPYAIVEARHNGTPLRLVIAGDYPSQRAALAAARQLKGVEAWPRSFRELQSRNHPVSDAAPAP